MKGLRGMEAKGGFSLRGYKLAGGVGGGGRRGWEGELTVLVRGGSIDPRGRESWGHGIPWGRTHFLSKQLESCA